MKKLFLHIGFNKTGSTSIQRNLALNAKALRSRGILYPHDPDAPYTQRWQHVPLAAAVPGNQLNWLSPRKKKTKGAAWDKLAEVLDASDCSTVILSSEGFGGLTMQAEQIDWLKKKLAGFDITVIAYIRRQDSYFLSAYQQRIKAGSSTPFRFDMHETMPALCFSQRLAPWRAAFGPERVIVRPFAPALWPENELFTDFLQALDIDHEGLALAEPSNEGLDHRAVELLRRLNMQHSRNKRKKTKSAVPPRRHNLDLVLNLERFMPPGFRRQKMQLSSEQAEELRAYYRSDNEAALAGSGISVDDFFPPVAPGREACLPPETLPKALLFSLIDGLARSAKIASAEQDIAKT